MYRHTPAFIGFVIAVCILGTTPGCSQKVVLKETFASASWMNTMRQHAGGAGNTIETTTVGGKSALLMYDNDPKGSTILDTTIELPQNGRIAGKLMFPAVYAGAPTKPNAYVALQMFTEKKPVAAWFSIQRSTRTATVSCRLMGKKAEGVLLPEVVADDAWIPWQISWEWDGVSDTGLFRVAIFDKETDPTPFDAGQMRMLRIVSGWSTAQANAVYLTDLSVTADADACAVGLADDLLRRAPFAVIPKHEIFTDSFVTPSTEDENLPDGWYNWKPASDTGDFIYDHSYGRRDLHSLCFNSTSNAVWQRKMPINPGATYRLSGWLKVEQAAPNATVMLSMQPRGVLNTTGKENWIKGRSVPNEIALQPGYWQYLETFWTAPDSGEYVDGTLTLIDIEFFGKRLSGKAWCDDVRLDEVTIAGPWYADFATADSVTDQWRVYAFRGLEGQGEARHAEDGFGDAGAVRINQVRGQPGFSAACVLDRDLLDPLRDWTFVAHGIGLAGSEATLVVEQLDADEQVLLKTAAEPPKQTEGWRRHTVTFNLLPTARQVRLLCVNDGKGSAVFDNAWLRPAWENEIIDDAETFPVMVGIFPADVVAAIDRTPPVITIPSRQAGAIVLHLHGDRETKAQTRVEIEAPDWLKLRTAQMATYGKEPLEATTRAAQVAGRTLFTFTDPYNWQRSMRGGKPNPYTGLMVVWRAVAAPGTEDTVTIRTFLGEQQGQVRDIKLAVREPIPQVPEPKRFKVGIWGLGWLHVRDKDAYRDLLQTYVNAGVRRGSMHESHGHALPVMKEVGFEPTMILHAVNSTLPYKSLPADKRPPYAVGLEGKQVKHYIALAAALNDPDVHALYRKYLKRYLRSYPDFGKVGVIDIEFWGDGSVSQSDFHPTTIAEFRKRTKIPADVELTAKTILKDHYQAWSDFRNALTAELHGVSRDILRGLRPDMELWAYDYPLGEGGQAPEFVTESPMNSLLYEPYIDGHLVSYYNREGTRFLDSVDNDARHLQKPIWAVPFLMKNITNIHNRSYNYAQIGTKELRFEILGAAASGARGHFGFPGKLMDADYLHAYAQGVAAVVQYEDFYIEGKRHDELVTLTQPPGTVRHRVHELGGRLLLTLFNGGREALQVRWTYAGKETATDLQALGFEQIVLTR